MDRLHDFICEKINKLNLRYIKKYYCESQLYTHAKSITYDELHQVVLTLNKYPHQTWFEYFKSIGNGGDLLVDCGLAIRLIHILFGENDEKEELVFHSSYGSIDPHDLYLKPFLDEEKTLISHLSDKKHMGMWLFSFDEKDYIGLCDQGMKRGDLNFWRKWLIESVQLPTDFRYLGDYNDVFRRYVINSELWLLSKESNIKVNFYENHVIVHMLPIPLYFVYAGFKEVQKVNRAGNSTYDDRGFWITHTDRLKGIVELHLIVQDQQLEYIGQELLAKVTIAHTDIFLVSH